MSLLMNRLPYFPFIWVFLSLLVFVSSVTDAADRGPSRYNKKAQALAKQIAPTPPAKNFRKEDIAGLGKRMAAAIQFLENSHRTSGPAPESLIATALSFRNDMGDYEKVMLTNALLTNWREANGRGLFDKHGKYQVEVTRGRGVGDKMMFELIVPGKIYPPGSNQLANVRLILADRRRTDEESITDRERATMAQLKKMIEQKTNIADRKKWEALKMNDLGRTKEQETTLWQKDMDAAGEAGKKLPSIRIFARSDATPTHATKFRWRSKCEILNTSPHPTEVKVEFWQMGYTWKKRDHYIMSKTEKTFKLRQSQSVEFDVYSKPEGSYKGRADNHDGLSKAERRQSKVRYRGYVVRVTHEKGLASFTGNDQLAASYVNPAIEDMAIEKLPTF